MIVVDELCDRDFGEFEGRDKTLHRDWYEDFWDYHKNLHYERAENVRDFIKRINNQIEEIEKKYAGKNVLVVAHSGVGLAFSAYFNGIPCNGRLLKYLISNGEIAKYGK